MEDLGVSAATSDSVAAGHVGLLPRQHRGTVPVWIPPATAVNFIQPLSGRCLQPQLLLLLENSSGEGVEVGAGQACGPSKPVVRPRTDPAGRWEMAAGGSGVHPDPEVPSSSPGTRVTPEGPWGGDAGWSVALGLLQAQDIHEESLRAQPREPAVRTPGAARRRAGWRRRPGRGWWRSARCKRNWGSSGSEGCSSRGFSSGSRRTCGRRCTVASGTMTPARR